MPHNMIIRYFRLPYFHVSNSALFSTEYFGILILHRRSFALSIWDHSSSAVKLWSRPLTDDMILTEFSNKQWHISFICKAITTPFFNLQCNYKTALWSLITLLSYIQWHISVICKAILTPLCNLQCYYKTALWSTLNIWHCSIIHTGLNKSADIPHTTFSNPFPCMKMTLLHARPWIPGGGKSIFTVVIR